MQDVVEQMRDDIERRAARPGLQTFKVGFVSNDPETARKVTERLASLYIEENLRDRESLAENTSLFLESQLEDTRRRLKVQEEKLEAVPGAATRARCPNRSTPTCRRYRTCRSS